MPVSFLETGILYCEDNLRQLSQFPDECIDLIYLDPPFFSNQHYEVIWGDEAEVRSFEDRWKGGIEVYIDWMCNRIIQMRRILKPTGSLYLHCDPHASHYLKVMLDGIFGMSNFRNEIIWKRSTAHSDAKQGRRQYGALHDVLFFYTKTDRWRWNPLYTAYDERYVATKYSYVEEGTGRKYRLDNLTGPGGASKGNPGYEVMGVTRHWRYTQEKMVELIREGRVIQTKPGGVPQYKRYLDEGNGVPVQDLWTDISPVNSQAAERLGYPTQKPEALLERIIGASSIEGDIVLDPFCGCGTTVTVAERMRRRWIGIDISPTAVNLMRSRLERLTNCRCAPKIVGLPVSVDELRALKPFEFQNWVIQKFRGTHSPRKSGDMGIDGYSRMGNPIQVKRSDRVGRNVVDNFETAVRRAGKDIGYVVAFSFTRGAYEEVARARRKMNLDVHLVAVEELLADELDKIVPELASITDLPLLPARPRDARPSAQELIDSDKRAV